MSTLSMNVPLVSVVIPVFNGAPTIRQAIQSALNQTYQNLEVIVVDDASTDESRNILQEFGNTIRPVFRDTNSGVCDRARFDGLKYAANSYCAFLDQDDLWEADKVARQVAFMEDNLQYPLSHTYMQVIDESGAMHEIRHEGLIPPSGPCARELLDHCFLTISSVMVRAPGIWIEALLSHRMRNSNSDLETLFHIHRTYPAGFGFLPEVLGSYRRWTKSISRQDWKWAPEDVNELERVYMEDCWRELLERKDLRNALYNAYVTNAHYYDQQGIPGRSLYFVRHGLRHGLTRPRLYTIALRTLCRGLLGAGFRTEFTS